MRRVFGGGGGGGGALESVIGLCLVLYSSLFETISVKLTLLYSCNVYIDPLVQTGYCQLGSQSKRSPIAHLFYSPPGTNLNRLQTECFLHILIYVDFDIHLNNTVGRYHRPFCPTSTSYSTCFWKCKNKLITASMQLTSPGECRVIQSGRHFRRHFSGYATRQLMLAFRLDSLVMIFFWGGGGFQGLRTPGHYTSRAPG